MAPSLCIVGAGPAGIYCAEAVNRRMPEVTIDVIDRSPAPYGLVRSGVAPDHQGTKAVTRVFDRILQKPGMRFLGNVSVGDAVTLADLHEIYDAVVLATGAHEDRRLGIPGEDLEGVYGSSAFVFWYNGEPNHRDLAVDLTSVSSVAVIGNGNVAIDVARVLVKSPAEMAKSDLALHVAEVIHGAAIKDVHIIGRRGPVEANFGSVELAELGRLERAVPLVDATDLPANVGDLEDAARRVKEANLATFRSFAGNRPDDKPIRLHFHFHARLLAILGESRVQAIRLERRGESHDLPAQMVVTCIGHSCGPLSDVPYDPGRGIIANHEGRVAPGLYVVGWAKRGPSGVIATNRPDSAAVADLIVADLAGAIGKPGPAALDTLLRGRGIRAVSFADWLKIDAAERGAAATGAPRRKFDRVADMLAALG